MTSEAAEELLFASLAADNAAAFYADLVAHLSRALGRQIRLVNEPAWHIREQQLHRGEAHLGVVCGLQYVLARHRDDEPGIDLLAAPVMRGSRYRRKPVYFSDVVVQAGHPLADSRICLEQASRSTSAPRTQATAWSATRLPCAATRAISSAHSSNRVPTNARQR
jgi:ABC-type phosphate/phosphonate transport system substrate-binding protein